MSGLPIWRRKGFRTEWAYRQARSRAQGYTGERQRLAVQNLNSLTQKQELTSREQKRLEKAYKKLEREPAATPVEIAKRGLTRNEEAQLLGWDNWRERIAFQKGIFERGEGKGYVHWRKEVINSGRNVDQFDRLYNAARRSGWDTTAGGAWSELLEYIGWRMRNAPYSVGETP